MSSQNLELEPSALAGANPQRPKNRPSTPAPSATLISGSNNSTGNSQYPYNMDRFTAQQTAFDDGTIHDRMQGTPGRAQPQARRSFYRARADGILAGIMAAFEQRIPALVLRVSWMRIHSRNRTGTEDESCEARV